MVAKIMLVDPPIHHLVSQFVGGVYWYPSLAVGYLKSVLASINVACACRHLNAEYHNFLVDEIDTIEPEDAILTLYTFSSMLFPDYYRGKGRKLLNNVREVATENRNYDFNDRLEFFETEVTRWVDKWIENVNWSNYGLVGFSAVTLTQLIPGLYLAKSIKRTNPDILTVFGGFACQGDFGVRLIENFDQIDIMANGEGEPIIKDLAHSLDGTLRIGSVKGTIQRRGRAIVRKAPQPLNQDLSSLSFPDYSDYPNADKIEELLVELGRGCPWGKCAFCTSFATQGYRMRPAEHVFQELLYESDRHKTRRFVFIDLDILGNTHNFERLCDLLISEGRDFDLFAEACAHNVNRQLLEKMYKAGFRRLQVGFESFSDPLLRKMKKNSEAIDNIKVLKWGTQLGMNVSGNIIVGFPGETVDDLRNSLKIMRSCSHLLRYTTMADFNLNYGSVVYANPKEFGVTINYGTKLNNFDKDEIARLLFGQDVFPWLPEKTRDQILPYFYSFKRDNESPAMTSQLTEFRNLIDESLSKWRAERPELEYYDMKSFLQIRDDRTHRVAKIFTLEHDERDIFILCESIQTLDSLQEALPRLSKEQIKEKLDLFMKHDLIYGDGKQYVNLCIREK